MLKHPGFWSACEQRHLAAASEFTADIQHVAGKSILVSDCHWSLQFVGMYISAIAADQHSDVHILTLQSEPTSHKLEERKLVLNCSVTLLLAVPALWFPFCGSAVFFDGLHSLSHS